VFQILFYNSLRSDVYSAVAYLECSAWVTVQGETNYFSFNKDCPFNFVFAPYNRHDPVFQRRIDTKSERVFMSVMTTSKNCPARHTITDPCCSTALLFCDPRKRAGGRKLHGTESCHVTRVKPISASLSSLLVLYVLHILYQFSELLIPFG